MDMNKRTYLKKGDMIRLKRERHSGLHSEDVWKILGIVGEGGSSICYQASCGKKTGRLKEFYPIAKAAGMGPHRTVILKRRQDCQLLPFSDSMADSFREMRKEFISAYDKLEDAKRANGQNEVLNNFIPPYEILYGCDETSAAGSVYIWTPDDKKGKGFDIFLKEVRNAPHRQSERKLYQILNTILTLTDCVKALHMAGLLHLDLKPSNFLVPFKSDMELNTNTISLFDVNTLYYVYSTVPRIAGTRGFCAPEVMKGKAENRSDIYSIGAILFHAIVICDTVPDGVYQEDFYQQIEQLVSESELVQASSVNSNVFLKYWLVTILKKCLAKRPNNRYGNCEGLMSDIEKAKVFLEAAVAEGKLGENRKIAVVEKETVIKDRPQWAFHQMLYQDPLYRRVQDGEPIEVLVIGAGNYGQRFIDICLQTGQMLNHELHITVYSAEPGLDKNVYMQFRPALANFVDVNGSMKGQEEQSYGSLYFDECSFIHGEEEKNKKKTIEILKKKAYQYIFISLGDDELSESVAITFADSVKTLQLNCSIHFAVRGEQKKEYHGGEPVYLNEKVTAKQIDPQLERMAFLTHTCWNSFDGDQKIMRKEFLQKYNYVSSLSYALSVFFKLNSIGIKTQDLEEAASQFCSKIQDGTGKRTILFNQLVALEHRRWVLEKVTNGWSAPLSSDGRLDLMGCVKKGSVKDHAAKLHPCIVRSTENTPLRFLPYSTNQNEVWDQPNPLDETLDELDSMSVELHRCFKKQRDMFCKTMPLQSGDFMLLQKELSHEPPIVLQALQKYQMCLQEILKGSKTASNQYPYIEKKLMNTLSHSAASIQEKVALRLKQIHRDFFPVIEYNLYRDYKLYDEVLIEKIPFILTYQPYPHLGMPYYDDNGYLFDLYQNALVLKPKKITVFAYLDEKTRLERFIERMNTAIELFEERQIQSKLFFVITVADCISELKGNIMAALGVENVTVISSKNTEDALHKLHRVLRRKHIDLFGDGAIFEDSNDGIWKEYLAEKKLSPGKTAEYTKYLETTAFLRCTDIYHMLHQPVPQGFHPEFAEEYQPLWKIRKKYGSECWKKLCLQLKTRADSQDLFMEGSLKKEKEHTFIYLFPTFGIQTISKFLEELKENRLVSEDSYVIAHTSDMGKVQITTSSNLQEIFDRIFTEPYLLTEEMGLSLRIDGRNSFSVIVNQLRVEKLLLSEDMYQVLEELQALHMIHGLKKVRGKVSFAFSSSQAKRMLTDANEILHTYVYYEIGWENNFDDVLFTKNGCILTKGFDTYFLEVNHVNGKIHSIADYFKRGKKLCVYETGISNEDVIGISVDNIKKSIKNIVESI